MARVCQVTGRGPMSGNNVSHSNRKTRRRFGVNLHTKRFWDEVEECYVTLRVSARAIRTITKKGVSVVLAELREKGAIA